MPGTRTHHHVPSEEGRRRAKIKTTELMFTALVECLNWRTPNGLNVQDVNSGSMLTHAFKLNQSTLIPSVTGFVHSVSKLSSVVFVAIFRCTYTILHTLL